MLSPNPGGGAKIIQFRPRGRTEHGQPNPESKAAAHLESLGVAYAECGSGWYHEAAMQDAGNPGKR